MKHAKLLLPISVTSRLCCTSLWFTIIEIGGLTYALSGYLSKITVTQGIAFITLLLSCVSCIFSLLAFTSAFKILFVGILFFGAWLLLPTHRFCEPQSLKMHLPKQKGCTYHCELYWA